MSKWYEIVVAQYKTVLVEMSGDGEDELNEAGFIAVDEAFCADSDTETLSCKKVKKKNLESSKRHADEVLPMEGSTYEN